MNDIKHLLEEKQRYENIIKAINIGTWEYYVETGEIKHNDVWAEMIGYSLNELESTHNAWEKLIHPEDLKKTRDILKRVFSKELPYYEMEFRMKHKNGNWIWVSDKGEVVSWNSEGKPILMVGAHIDITENKRIIEELKRKEKHILESQSIARLGTWRLDVKTDEIVWTEELYKMYGFDPTKPVPNYSEHMKLFTRDSWEKLSKALELIRTKGISYELVLEKICDKGSCRWMWVKGEAEKDEDGKIIAIWGAAQDITERIKIMNLQKESEERLRLVLNSTTSGIYVIDKNDLCTYVNKSTLDLLGYDDKYELLGKKMHELTHHSHEDGTPYHAKDCFLLESFKEGKVINKDDIIWKKDGTYIHVSYTASPQFDDGKILGVVVTFRDITEKRNYEEALVESNYRFKKLYENAPLGYQSLDADGYFLDVNQTWLDMLGYDRDEVIGKWFGDFLVDKYRKLYEERFEIFKKEGKITSEFEIFHKNKSILFIEFEGLIGYNEAQEIDRTYCILNNITKRREIHQRLELSEKNLKLAQSIAKIGSWQLNLEDNFVWASDEAFSIYELKNENNFIQLPIIQSMVDHNDREKLDKALKALITHNEPYDVTFVLHTQNGKDKYIRSKAAMFKDIANKPIKIIGIVNDITDLKRNELELKYLSQHDYLTDLYNRRYYFQQFKRFNNRAFLPLGVMMLDVNGLKIINDAFGHKIGDNALKLIADTLKNIFEEKDVISRIGGDEFTVLLPNSSAKQLQAYKEQIVEVVKTLKVENIELSLSIGYEIRRDFIEDIDDIQKQAENRMYRHKTTEGSSVRSKAINAILVTLTDKYETERRHSAEVSHLCKLIGLELNLDDDDLKELEQAGLFHDIGKISIPDSILNKPGRLTEEEFDIIKTHTEVGYQILRAADEFSDLAIHALHHHERWDGKGYPRGLKALEIPLFSRIICIVDAYEAMTADRPYRKKMSKTYAVSEIVKYSGSQFDPKIAKIFVEKILKRDFIINKS